MAIATIGNFSELIEVLVTAVSILGGLMAFYSGREARRSVRSRRLPGQTAHRINQGLADGFGIGLPVAVVTCVILVLA